MAVLRNGSKCSHTTCMLRFFTVSRLALNTNLTFEIGSTKKGNNPWIMSVTGVRSVRTTSMKQVYSEPPEAFGVKFSIFRAKNLQL
jgi:hypothetical protein